MSGLRAFYGPNAGYVVELYERYLRDPSSVDPEARALFERWAPPLDEEAAPSAPGVDASLVARAADLANAIRAHGHLAASLDPLGQARPAEPLLDAATHGLSEAGLAALPASVVGGLVAEGAASAREAIAALRRIYCGTTGYEFGQVADPAERAWLRDAVESRRFAGPLGPEAERDLLEQLTRVESFERYLHRAFPGQTRFSVEGTDALVPMLEEMVRGAAEAGICEVHVGMAHRGRLNVLAHVLGKPYAAIMAEFQGAIRQPAPTLPDSHYPGWAGDVKYHLGARRAYPEPEQVRVLVKLAPNPSHLEFVDPLVEGMARADGDDRRHPGEPRHHVDAALPVLVHGDAAFPGEGIVAETLNLSRLAGYSAGGTIHVVVDNQLGFTAEPEQTRSTRYASDLAKGFEIPIAHVNADDPPACVTAVRLAVAYRQRFHRDFLIDLVGYRRRGHNEGDEPAFTQPLMYQRIASHPTARELWARDLASRGVVSREEAEAMAQASLARLREARDSLAEPDAKWADEPPPEPERRGDGDCAPPEEVATAVPGETLIGLNEALTTLPSDFAADPKVERLLRRRAAALGLDGVIDWAHAETLAFASILAEGTPIRLTGQDTARGTFSQRHAVLHDRETGQTCTPLQALPQARASFDVRDSPLSEAAALGFEYGYSVEAPDALVLWEAQYGDFVNAAQVVVDQFVVADRAKWGQTSALVLLLPHGYEGQGPEHSSARVERFLQLASDRNLRVANPSTAAQYFHLLRRQAALLGCDPRPLVVLTPKSLLRNPLAGSRLADLTDGRFSPVVDDPEARARAAEVTRLVLCGGKLYFDLVAAGDQPASVTVARVEELYPFPEAELSALIASYPALEEVVWAQEEPENMGAWRFVAPRLRGLVGPRVPIVYVGRPEMATPAEGSAERHAAEQARIVRTALTGLATDGRSQRAARGLRRAS